MKTENIKYKNGINTTLKLLRECILWFPLLLSFPSATGETLSSEQTLESVKQALVELALGSEIQIKSMAYLDNGILHESSILSSQATFRGIPVFADAGNKPKARIKNSTLSDQNCHESRVALRREALVRVVKNNNLLGSNKPLGDHSVLELAAFIGQVFTDSMEGSENWSVTSEKEYGSAYDSYVLGSLADRAPYRFDIEIRPRLSRDGVKGFTSAWVDHGLYEAQGIASRVANSIPGINYRKSWPSVELEYQLTLTDRATQLQIWQKALPLYFPKVKRDYFKSSMPSALVSDIADLTAKFIQEATDSLQCRPHRFQLFVDKGGFGQITINAGLVAGVNVGDQFLISAGPDLLKEVLSHSGLDRLALAKVDSVTSHSATLKKIAGPSWPVSSDIPRAVATYF